MNVTLLNLTYEHRLAPTDRNGILLPHSLKWHPTGSTTPPHGTNSRLCASNTWHIPYCWGTCRRVGCAPGPVQSAAILSACPAPPQHGSDSCWGWERWRWGLCWLCPAQTPATACGCCSGSRPPAVSTNKTKWYKLHTRQEIIEWTKDALHIIY